MSTVDLEDKPIFDALSYTWGNPQAIYEEPDKYPLSNEDDSELLQRPKKNPEKTPQHEMFYAYVDYHAQQYRQTHRSH
jgi:hypothetical protein